MEEVPVADAQREDLEPDVWQPKVTIFGTPIASVQRILRSGEDEREGGRRAQIVGHNSRGAGNTAGSSGLLPSLKPTSGRIQFCHAVPPLGKPTCGPTLVTMQVSRWQCAPTTPECKVSPLLFPTPTRLRKPHVRGCGDPVDLLGRHRAGTGRLKKRATPIERMVARIFREAGAQVRYLIIGVSSADERRVEVLTQDLPCAVDVTLVSVLCSSGEPQSHAAEVDGAALERARHVKEATYPELPATERCRLVSSPSRQAGNREEAVHTIRQTPFARDVHST